MHYLAKIMILSHAFLLDLACLLLDETGVIPFGVYSFLKSHTNLEQVEIVLLILQDRYTPAEHANKYIIWWQISKNKD